MSIRLKLKKQTDVWSTFLGSQAKTENYSWWPDWENLIFA
jgi:hypothetical protein